MGERPSIRHASLYAGLSLIWLIGVGWLALVDIRAHRYAELGFDFLILTTVRDHIIGALPILLPGVPALVLALRIARRPRGLAGLACALLLVVLASRVPAIENGLQAASGRWVRVALTGSIVIAIAAVGVVVGNLLGRLSIARLAFVAGSRFLDATARVVRSLPILRHLAWGPVSFVVPVVAATAIVVLPMARPTPPGSASFVVVVIDTLRADHLGIYGYDRPTSPRIDSWASGAAVFTSGIAQASWTKPSVASLFTSLFPSVHRTGSGVHVRREVSDGRVEMVPGPPDAPGTTGYLPPALVTMAEVFREAGYRTVGFVGNSLVAREDGYGQGFEVYRTLGDRRITAEACRWLEENGDEPFLLYLHYMAPHAPYDPPIEFDRFGERPAHIEIHGSATKDSINFTRTLTLTPEDVGELIDQYDGEVLFVDALVGEVLDTLSRSRAAGRAVTVLTADHGEEFLDHGMVWHESIHLYRELTRVPFVISLPGEPVGSSVPRSVPDPVMQIDLAPTLLALADLEPPAEMQGRSLVPLLVGDALPPRSVFSETLDWGYRQSVQRDRRKLIYDRDNGASELYDVEVDPGEIRNLVGQAPELRQSLLDSLSAHARASESRVERLSLSTEGLSREQIEKLRSLGYVQ